MRKYLVSIFILLIAGFILVLIVRLAGTNKLDEVSQSAKQAADFPTEELFVSDYFANEFEDVTSDSSSNTKVDFETCDLLGERVRQGTVIFDSTCASSE